MLKLINWISEHKGALMIFLGLCMLLFVFYIDTLRLRGENLGLPSFGTNSGNDSGRNIVNELEVISISPIEGTKVTSLDPYNPVTISFSSPVEPDSVSVSIVPYLEYSVKTGIGDTNTAVILPKLRGWEPHVEYVIKVMQAKGVDGSVLLKNPVYRYKNTPPPLDYRTLPY